MKNHTWDLCKMIDNRKLVDCKWVYIRYLRGYLRGTINYGLKYSKSDKQRFIQIQTMQVMFKTEDQHQE